MEPDPEQTPGELCQNPDEYRYPERIPYCERNVSKGKKSKIIKVYEEMFDFSVAKLGRENFKIDHLIPLCAGGSNDDTNLWPQYKIVFEDTDPAEGLICEKMAAGLLLQKDAVAMVLDMKHYRKSSKQILEMLNSLQAPPKKNKH